MLYTSKLLLFLLLLEKKKKKRKSREKIPHNLGPLNPQVLSEEKKNYESK